MAVPPPGACTSMEAIWDTFQVASFCRHGSIFRMFGGMHQHGAIWNTFQVALFC